MHAARLEYTFFRCSWVERDLQQITHKWRMMDTRYQTTADYSGLTYIWENLKRASMLMLRSNTSMVATGEESLKRSKVRCSRQVPTDDNQQRYKVLCYTTIKGLVRGRNFV